MKDIYGGNDPVGKAAMFFLYLALSLMAVSVASSIVAVVASLI